MEETICTCKLFDTDEMPSAHAMSSIKKRHMEYYECCSRYYRIEALVAIYEGTFHSIGNTNTWDTPKEMKTIRVDALIEKRKVLE